MTADLKTQIDRLTVRITLARIVAKVIHDGRQREKRMAGGEFFALIDEMDGSERRLDALAKPVLEKLALLEKRATTAIEGKQAKLDAAIDYVARMDSATQKLEQNGKPNNGGPIVPGSEVSPLPSTDAQPSIPSPVVEAAPHADAARGERAPSDYIVTNGIGR